LVCTDSAGNGLVAAAGALDDYSFQFLEAPLNVIQISERMIHLQAIDPG
jgi:hypothetical protein